MSTSPLSKTSTKAAVQATQPTATPFNLSDVVPFRNVEAINEMQSPAVKTATKWKDGTVAMYKLWTMMENLGEVTREEKSSLASLNERWSKKSTETALAALASDGFLPETLHTNATVARLASLPTVEMGELRRVVDVLDMVIMPFSYMRPAAYEKESLEMRGAIKAFAEEVPAAFAVYVAAPVQYYDVSRHVAADDDQPIFAGRHVAPAFMAMGMALPMFRAITRDLNAIRDRTNDHSARLRQAEQQIQQLNTRVTQLQATVERQQAEMIQQNLRQAQLESELRAVEARASFMAYEPMMLAIPKLRTVLDNGHAIVGPCWGPDFDAIVMAALRLRKYDGQRAALSKAIQPFMPKSRW